MVLNKQKGNMYPWVTHTWNPIKGKCPHDCSYCYMKRFPQKEVRLDDRCFNDDLGSDNTIFVGSSCDIWAKDIPWDWVWKVCEHIEKYPSNTYLLQSKYPKRFDELLRRNKHLIKSFSKNVIVGTTIETNRDKDFGKEYVVSKAFPPVSRYIWLDSVDACHKMVSIEPIMDFDVSVLVAWIKTIKPDFVSIGADSKCHNLPEPAPEKIIEFVDCISEFTNVKIKSNLKRLYNQNQK